MKIVIRVGTTLAELDNFNRVSIESIGGRNYLTGTRYNATVIVLFVLKPGVSPDTITWHIQEALNHGPRVCILTDELSVIDDDAEAEKILEAYNASVEKLEQGNSPKPVKLANTLIHITKVGE